MYDALVLVTAVACGLVGGVFFAFSTFVMDGLSRLPATGGIAAMQAINRAAVRPAFMALLLGTALLCVVAAVLSVARGDVLVMVAAIVYVGGAVVLTAAVNVPLNRRVEALEPDDEVTHPVWADYLRRWVRTNHLRTVAGAVSCGLLVGSLLAR